MRKSKSKVYNGEVRPEGKTEMGSVVEMKKKIIKDNKLIKVP